MRRSTIALLSGLTASAWLVGVSLAAERWGGTALEPPRTHSSRFVRGGDGTALPDPGRVTALAAGDLNADGIPDLVCGRSVVDRHALSVHFGEVERVFHESSWVVDAPERPDFLAVGDFDADGDLDTVVAARGGHTLQLFEGNGRGGLAASQIREVPGSITALAAGEINRPDGLVDLALGIKSADGARLWILEGPNGALRSEAEVVALDAPAVALALGQFDGDYTRELIASAGNELVIVRGRDRRLVALDPVTDPPSVEQLTLTERAVGLAVGSFADDGGPAIALLSASGGVKLFQRRTGAEDSWTTLQEGRSELTDAAVPPFLVAARATGSAATDLVVVDGANRQLRMLSVPSGDRAAKVEALAVGGAPSAVLPMRLNADALADFVIGGESGLATATTAALATITVDTALDVVVAGDGLCTLREAIANANGNSETTGGDCAGGLGADAIAFAIAGGGAPATIAIGSALPSIVDSVVVDGNTQGCATPPCVVLQGSPASGNGLSLEGGSSTVRGLVIRSFPGHGIVLQSSGHIVEGCFIGTNASGTAAAPNQMNGVQVVGDDCTIGGTTPEARNVISGNGGTSAVFQRGVQIEASASGTRVQGNFIGTDITGTNQVGNVRFGIICLDSSAIIGGTDWGAGNVVSGNGDGGIVVGPGGTLVQGNRVGTDASGSFIIGESNGISVDFGVTVGGTTPAARNLSAGDYSGVLCFGSNIFVLGNYLGTDATGTRALPNTIGVRISQSSVNVVIGGTAAGARNVISGNEQDGIDLFSSTAHGVQIVGNFVGTDATGSVALPNYHAGIAVEEAQDTIVAGNLVSGNTLRGIYNLIEPQGTVIVGNLVGTDVTGTLPLGNGGPGIHVLSGISTIIGGPTPEERNVISANGEEGILIASSMYSAIGTEVRGNYIGTDITGTQDLGNGAHAIRIQDATQSVIGGREPGEGNLIRWNASDGVRVIRAVKNTNRNEIVGNTMLDQGLMGIDLGGDGVTPNDAGDSDGGANLLQNYSVLSGAEAIPGSVTIDGTLSSTSGAFTVDFYTGPPCVEAQPGEVERYLGSTSILTNGSGNASFSATLAVPVSDGDSILATATSSTANTSEFSSCITAVCLSTVTFAETLAAPDRDSLAWSGNPQDVRWVKGDLAALASYATLADGTLLGANALDISTDAPSAGQGLYYVVRPLGCGSWQSSPGAEPGRDVGWP